MRKISLLILATVFPVAFLFSQLEDEKTKLEKERQGIQKEIRDIQSQYDLIKGEKQQIMGQYNLLNRKIRLQNRFISSINRELRILDDDIYYTNREIYRLNRQLDTLKAQYARSVVYAYKNRSTYDFLNFIFSANSFNDAIKRIAYLKQYRAYREQQVNTIKETQIKIARKKEEIIEKKKEKDDALDNQQEQAKVLEQQKKEKNTVLSSLKSKESDLAKQLAAKKKRDRDLQNAITAIVRRIIEAEKKENTATVTAATPSSPATGPNASAPAKVESFLELNATEKALGASFESSKTRLPWPVDQGYVCIHYGYYEIENTKLKGNNPGITICTPNAGINVKSVFDGEVVGVFSIGDSRSVMIRHGKYFTVYSNLSSVNVSKGNMVKTGQVLGKVAIDDDDGKGGKLDFLLMIENNNVNPEPWLRR